MSNTQVTKVPLKRCPKCPHRLSDLASHEHTEDLIGFPVAKKCGECAKIGDLSSSNAATESGEVGISLAACRDCALSGKSRSEDDTAFAKKIDRVVGTIYRQCRRVGVGETDGDTDTALADELMMVNISGGAVEKEHVKSAATIYADARFKGGSVAPSPVTGGLEATKRQYKWPYSPRFYRIEVENFRSDSPLAPRQSNPTIPESSYDPNSMTLGTVTGHLASQRQVAR